MSFRDRVHVLLWSVLLIASVIGHPVMAGAAVGEIGSLPAESAASAAPCPVDDAQGPALLHDSPAMLCLVACHAIGCAQLPAAAVTAPTGDPPQLGQRRPRPPREWHSGIEPSPPRP